jgi:hypothetical protein
VWLLRTEPRPRPQDFFAAAQETPPSVVGNSGIALGLRVVVLAPCFGLGAAGDFVPVLLGGVFFVLGGLGFFLLRRPILAFIDEALARERSFTPARFLGPPLQVPAAVLIAIALLALLALEAKLTLDIIGPSHSWPGRHVAASVLLLLSGVAALTAGNGGAMQAMQLQLGFLYFGLSGAAVFLVYLRMAAVVRPSFGGTLAFALLALACLAIVLSRRNKYVEAKPVRRADLPQDALPSGERRASRLLASFVRLFNRAITTLFVVAVVFVGMQLYFSGSWRAAGTGSPDTAASGWIGLSAIAAVSFFAPILDPGNWQRLAALRLYSSSGRESAGSLRRAIATYALETPLICLAVCMLGAVAAGSEWQTGGSLADYAAYLAGQQHAVASTAMWFILLAVLAAAVSSITGTVQALLFTIRYDLLPRGGRS